MSSPKVNICSNIYSENYKEWDINSTTTELINRFIGYFIELNDKTYILSSYHGIRNGFNTKVAYGDDIIDDITCVCYSDYLDVALLEIPDGSYERLTLDDFKNFLIPTTGSCDFLNGDQSFNIHDVVFDKPSFNVPYIPYVSITPLGENLYESNYSSYSGSLLICENKYVIGMLSDASDQKLNVLPTVLLYKFLKEFSDTNSFSGLTFVPLEYGHVAFPTIKNQKEYGLITKNNYKISFENINSTKKYKFIDETLISSINDNKFDSTYKIYDENCNINVEFNTYIMMNFKPFDEIKINYYKYNKKTKEHVDDESSVVIKLKSIHEMRYLLNDLPNEYVRYKSFIFRELSEKKIQIMKNRKINNLYIQDKYLEKNPYCNNNKRIIIVEDLLNKDDKFEELRKDFPIKDCGESLNVAILSSINNIPITNIDQLRKMLDETETYEFKFIFNEKTPITKTY